MHTTPATVADSADEDDLAITDLLDALGSLKDPRKPQGRVYGLQFVLAAVLVAVLSKASNFRQVADHVADLPQSLLCRLGARWCHFRMAYACPSERMIRRLLCGIDADELDRTVGSWLRSKVDDADGVLALAIDGKVLRGSGAPGPMRTGSSRCSLPWFRRWE